MNPLLQHPAVFRFGHEPKRIEQVLGSGFAALDAALNGGWPTARLVEVMCDRVGVGELSLLLPVLPRAQPIAPTRETRKQIVDECPSLWIRSSAVPTRSAAVAYAPALAREGVDLQRVYFADTASAADTLWVVEQALLSGAVGHVFAWLHDHPRDLALRRIALAAKKSNGVCFLMRPTSAAKSASAAEVRVSVMPAPRGELEVTVLKRRGLLREQSVRLAPRSMPCLAPDRQPIAVPGAQLKSAVRSYSYAN